MIQNEDKGISADIGTFQCFQNLNLKEKLKENNTQINAALY